jgi:hypothetical protein
MPADSEIVSVRIHPAIGLARVGNSPEASFIGPEFPSMVPRDRGDFRDSEGRIKRQSARFRIYGLDRDGNVVREITARDASIRWTVHLANKKAEWFAFRQALDLPTAYNEVNLRRNKTVVGEDRSKLVIDPGQRSISGTNVNRRGGDARYAFDTGQFLGASVYLGELRTDAEGRLLVLGGHGTSASPIHAPLHDVTNNDGWYDDVSDGSVDAEVAFADRTLSAIGSWVIVGPPDYAPGFHSVITGYDLLLDTAIRLQPSLMPDRPEFFRDILPLFTRFSRLQWLNAGFMQEFGWGSPLDFSQPHLIRQLSDPSEARQALRQAMFARFRDPAKPVFSGGLWPELYGDNMFNLSAQVWPPQVLLAVLPSQYQWLRQWADGDFTARRPGRRRWNDLSPAEQCESLDRAALLGMTGGPFQPGAEVSWPMRRSLLYSEPFRIKRRPFGEPQWGDRMTPPLALSAGGPLDGATPGDLTRWLACPWQTDTVSCLSAYGRRVSDYLPTFWPERAPNDVLTTAAYEIVLDPDRPIAEREAAFDSWERSKWLRDIAYDRARPPNMKKAPYAAFLDDWANVGIVTRKPGPRRNRQFPPDFWVETGPNVKPT